MIPDEYADLLTRPLFGHLATVRPDGTPQANPMWFSWDGEYLRFTNTTTRQKYRNVTAEPRIAMSVNDPDKPYRYLVSPAESPPHISTAQLPAGRTGEPPEYAHTRGGPPSHPAETWIRRYTQRTSGGGH